MRRIILVLSLIAVLPIAGAADDMSGLTGWGGSGYVYFPDGQPLGTAPDVDINGEVGHPLYVSTPTAKCLPSHHWSGNSSVSTGTLPPGITLNTSNDQIGGIPTERGHWIVTMKEDGIKCGDQGYVGFTQQVRFHITGSGQVIQ